MTAPLAHIFVGRYSLPVPLGVVLLAAVLVVALSFALIYVAPPRIRDEADRAGKPVPAWVGAVLTVVWGAYIAFIALTALFGRQDEYLFNPATVLFWIWALPLIPILHCFLGGLYQVANPFAAIAARLPDALLLRNAETVVKRLGYWPAVLQLLAIVWGESIDPVVQVPRVLGGMTVAYVVLQISMGALLGPGWYRGGDVFQAVTQLASTISVAAFKRDDAGRLRFVAGFNPARALPWGRGREALITLWLAGVLADGLRQLPVWKLTIAPNLVGVIQALDHSLGVQADDAVTITAEILVAWILFSYFFWFFSFIAARLSAAPGESLSRRVNLVAETVAPSLIPIALAYLFAHNLTQILVGGPFLWTSIGQPAQAFAFLFARQDHAVSAAWVWWTQAGVIVLGHIIAVVMAHSRLGQAFRGREARRAEKPAAVTRRVHRSALRADFGWLSAMLIYTATSLWIIAQPITGG